MAHNPTIPASDKCAHESVMEYWHESDECGLDDCAVNECYLCGDFATECQEVK